MYFYPYDTVLVLTDSIFVNYGGHTGTSVAAQRQASYLLAEIVASEDIHSFFTPTIISGTSQFAWKGKYELEHNFIRNINQIIFLNHNDDSLLTLSTSPDIKDYFSLVDDERGLVMNYYPSQIVDAEKVRFVYECGLTSGTSYQPNILLGLTTYADIILNEILGYGNESPGDIGVQNFRNVGYSETRIGLIRTNFGSSARAQFVNKMFTGFRKLKYVGLG